MRLPSYSLLFSGILLIYGCGGGNSSNPAIVLSVALANNTIDMQRGQTLNVPVVVVAPTETVSFVLTGLPPGVTESYKESESNPSGLLTITTNSTASTGTYQPTITVGSSGQTASLVFTLVISK